MLFRSRPRYLAGLRDTSIVSLLEDKVVTVTGWHLLLFVTGSFVSSFFLGRRHVFMSMFRTWTVKRSSGLRHRWF